MRVRGEKPGAELREMNAAWACGEWTENVCPTATPRPANLGDGVKLEAGVKFEGGGG